MPHVRLVDEDGGWWFVLAIEDGYVTRRAAPMREGPDRTVGALCVVQGRAELSP